MLMVGKIIQIIFVVWFFVIGIIFFTPRSSAQADISHFTIILNQVRGGECCGPGSLDTFEAQLVQLENRNLPADFALRFDVLNDSQYLELIGKYPKFKYGALLEVIPSLAESAGVVYRGDDQNWYEAQHVYLIGYSQGDRQKLIDKYMQKYYQVFKEYPKFSSAWMIDAWSLKYLKDRYGVTVHQITREQFGTDSYTLYGGPVHYPYWPTTNWAMVPQTSSVQMPLIVRQTIMDPVYCWGDKTDSYTSQPNDYFMRDMGIEYFKHLFLQAHEQPNSYTFALVGLENSMSELSQQEFFRQLDIIAEWWNRLDQPNRVTNLSQFESWLSHQADQDRLTVYRGESQTNSGEKAWWINTPRYRARVRLSDGHLAITDLRLFDSSLTDPYLHNQAGSLGWWIVPFVLDSSRMRVGDGDWLNVSNDYRLNRPVQLGLPEELLIQDQVTEIRTEKVGQRFDFYDQDKLILSALENTIVSSQVLDLPISTDPSNPINNLQWGDYWGFRQNGQKLTAYVNQVNLDQIRQNQKQLLFPQVEFDQLDADASYLYVNNASAVAGRNPVRLVFFPKNKQGESIFLTEYPKVETNRSLDDISLYEQHGSNGMLFIDLNHNLPLQSEVRVSLDGFSDKVKIYFAPNCKLQPFYCLFHPQQSFWYIKSILEDKIRWQKAIKQQQELYLDEAV